MSQGLISFFWSFPREKKLKSTSFPNHHDHQAGGAHKRSWFRNGKAIGLQWDVQSGGHADETENSGKSGFHGHGADSSSC